MNKNKRDFIEFLMQANALKFGEFTLKSGRKAPYFINMGEFNSALLIKDLGYYYANAISIFKEYKPTCLFGPAYKGITLVVATALHLSSMTNLKICFNRKEVKDHGEGGNLIGYKPNENDNVIIVDDILTSGSSIIESIEIIKKTGANIIGFIVAVDRMEKGKEINAMQELKTRYPEITGVSIINIDDIVDFLNESETTKGMVEKINEYRKQYQ